ncbi:MAG TPA: hypothetical protein DEB23_00190 [Chitinophagaceae bacterium]|nr:hypothetical protein [Chitinophagaceae bacterium]
MLNNLVRIFKNEIIEFYCHPNYAEIFPEPKPAIKYLPDWFKRIPPVNENVQDPAFGGPALTAKKCFPLIDAMSLGYTIPLCGDLHVKVDNDMTEMKVHNPPEIKLAEFHSSSQLGDSLAPRYPLNAIKFVNYWVVKTAPGWSTLFIPPINHIDQPFTCLGGLVDTDRYPKEVNFPAIWNTPGFDGCIPAGTPLVTAIPIKRNAFDKKPKVRKMSNSEFKQIEKIRKQQMSRKHVYTQELREKK